MNLTRPGLVLAAVLTAASPGSFAADESSAPKSEKKSLRVLAPAERERRIVVPRSGDRREDGEKETIAFLGVETGPVSGTLGTQLGLGRGTGLVVHHVVPKSPADGRLQEHDILLKLDDQLLIETRQLAVLIRLRKEGEDVTLTYLRGGKQATVTIKLGRTEVPKHAFWSEAGGAPGPGVLPSGRFEFFRTPGGPDAERGEVDRVLSMIRRAPEAGPMRIQIDREGGPGIRAMAVNPGNSALTFADDAGSLELTFKDGTKSLVAKNKAGEETFSGPVTTPEERKALPPELRDRLERLEGMRELTFRTGSEFRGSETRVIRPRGIGAPEWERVPAPAEPGVL
jgi:serine protease Do